MAEVLGRSSSVTMIRVRCSFLPCNQWLALKGWIDRVDFGLWILFCDIWRSLIPSVSLRQIQRFRQPLLSVEMSNIPTFPNFEPYGYQVLQELGHNLQGGRQTFLACQLDCHHPEYEPLTDPQCDGRVVIKQFQFAQTTSAWSEFQAHESEVEMLQRLNHPGIPKYLNAFETHDGFCMVQEYKDAKSLAISRNWEPQSIKSVAIALLDILVYLQDQPVSVIHQDIKPENILVDEALNIYLVDFGFARLGGDNLAASSMVKGTMGFMPPEQLFNRELTNASDLYSLGVTLICLVTGIRSSDIGSLILANYHIRFRELVPPLHRGWINWLEKLVEPNPAHRYSSAREALLALDTLDVRRVPKLKLNHDVINIQASQFGQPLEQEIVLINSIPYTQLSGRWEVVAHPHDPADISDEHSWIRVSPQYFAQNTLTCRICIDTQWLEPAQTYHRELQLHTNAVEGTTTVPVEIRTAPFPPNLPYRMMAIAALIGLGIGVEMAQHHSFAWLFAMLILLPIFASIDYAVTWTARGRPIHIGIGIWHITWQLLFNGVLWLVIAVILLLLSQNTSIPLAFLVIAVVSEATLQTPLPYVSLGILLWLLALTGWSSQQTEWSTRRKKFYSSRIKKIYNVALLIILIALSFPISIFALSMLIAFGYSRAWDDFFESFIPLLILAIPVLLVLLGHYTKRWLRGKSSVQGLASLPLLAAGLSIGLGLWLGTGWHQYQALSYGAASHTGTMFLLVAFLPLGCFSILFLQRIYCYIRLQQHYQNVQRIQP